MVAADAAACNRPPGITIVDHAHAADGAEIVLAFGGDGTFLRAAELARPVRRRDAGGQLRSRRVPGRGRAGRAGPRPSPRSSTTATWSRSSPRSTPRSGSTTDCWRSAWALNEASLERTNRERILEVAVAIDSRPLLRFGCDGVLCSTPTGSTAYAYSAGGPDRLAERRRSAHRAERGARAVRPSDRRRSGIGRRHRPAASRASGSAQLRRTAIGRGAGRRSGPGAPRRTAGVHRPHRAVEFRRPTRREVPIAGAWVSRRPARHASRSTRANSTGELTDGRRRPLVHRQAAQLRRVPSGWSRRIVCDRAGRAAHRRPRGDRRGRAAAGTGSDGADRRDRRRQDDADQRPAAAVRRPGRRDPGPRGRAAGQRRRTRAARRRLGDARPGSTTPAERSTTTAACCCAAWSAAAGRSRAFIGGAPAPVSVLAELADRLVAVHGQADQLRLEPAGAASLGARPLRRDRHQRVSGGVHRVARRRPSDWPIAARVRANCGSRPRC